MMNQNKNQQQELEHQRYQLLHRLETWLNWPMVILAFIWLILLIWEWTWGLSSILNTIVIVIWIIFILNFVIELILAPKKINYLRTNWLTAISLFVPALRILRILKALRLLTFIRITRGASLVRFLSSINRGMKSLGMVMSHRGTGYVVLLTFIVTFTGAAGIYTFEKNASATQVFKSYGSSLWWTAMIITTMGSQDWPVTPEGRILCLLLALYAFAIFGYVTAILATFFIGKDRSKTKEGTEAFQKIDSLTRQISALQKEIQNLIKKSDKK
jgi:voltage-gated potassium channel